MVARQHERDVGIGDVERVRESGERTQEPLGFEHEASPLGRPRTHHHHVVDHPSGGQVLDTVHHALQDRTPAEERS